MLEGLMWGLLFYIIAFIVGLWFYRRYSPLYQRESFVMLLSWVGHFVGTYAFTLIPTDSLVIFFVNATPTYTQMGTQFVENMVWYIREYMTGDSYVGTLYFFSAFSFLGSVAWYLLYVQLSQWLRINHNKYVFPALVLMCWPSYLFFTAGIGKDSLCFLLLPLILLSATEFMYLRKITIGSSVMLIGSLFLATMIRPYLLLIVTGAYFLTKVQLKLSFLRLLFIIAMLPVVYYTAEWVITSQTNMTDITVMSIASRAQAQQEYLSAGTSFPRLSDDPLLVMLSLPYSFLMNLTMPLFYLANNAIGMIASVENAFLVYLLYTFWKNRQSYKIIKNQNNAVKFCFNFFLVGMSFLSLINSNLGLATRQKSMYVPAFLVVAMLVWLYNKQARKRLIPSAAVTSGDE